MNTEFEIKPERPLNLGIKEIWEYKELLYFFTWRDIKVKYKQTFFGFLWAVFQPAIMTALFTLGFGKMISGSTSLNLPYPVFALSGFLLWNMFSNGLTNAGNSMVNNANIIKKIYFPRLIIPISSILVTLIDFLIAFTVFCPVLYYYNCSFNSQAFFLIPLSVALVVMATFGLGTLMASLNIKYRDFRYALPFLIQAMLFITPVIYPIQIDGGGFFSRFLSFNPMSAPIELFRASVSQSAINGTVIISSIGTSLLLLLAGLFNFRKTESYFADLA